ncbi:MAG TPA: tetratricopeptide repeat protein [Thermoanaerobaculia bacterium]|nr:tetratricopeptide repeat protein [Thermoanaerobaculia bacterium]
MVRRALRTSSVLLMLLAATGGCGSSRADINASEAQRAFGVRMAKMNLWREAMFRFKRAVEINPEDPMAHNNLAVAYEANGDFDSALKEYKEALRLDKSNQYIAKNYSRFVEFTQRNKKRQKRDEAKAAAAATPTPAPTNTPPGPPPAPTGAAPAAVPPQPPPPTTPPPTPPGNAAVSAAGPQASRLRDGETPSGQPARTPALQNAGGSR